MKLTELLESKEDEKKFPDTKQGAIEAFKYMASKSFVKSFDLDTAIVTPDSSVNGVWAIDSMALGQRVIIYLFGYKDSSGRVRDMNDFEDGDLSDRDMKRYIERGQMSAKATKAFERRSV